MLHLVQLGHVECLIWIHFGQRVNTTLCSSRAWLHCSGFMALQIVAGLTHDPSDVISWGSRHKQIGHDNFATSFFFVENVKYESFTFLALISLFFPIKRNAQISKATTYKWPYNSNWIFVLVWRCPVNSDVSFLQLVPWTFCSYAAFSKKESVQSNQRCVFHVEMKKSSHNLHIRTATCYCFRKITVLTYNKEKTKVLHSFIVM